MSTSGGGGSSGGNALIREAAERRGVEGIIHFHCDHFEPDVIIRRPDFSVKALKAFLDQCKPWVLSPFVYLSIPVMLQEDVLRDPTRRVLDGVADDPVCFLWYSQTETLNDLMRMLHYEGYDIHLHLHHELWTRNSCDVPKMTPRPQSKLSPEQRRLREWVVSESTPEMDARRFERCVQLYLRWFESLDISMRTWGFVHGCWALNGSDDRICTISNEIVILNRNGCFGDFSFPAGRPHCNPRIKTPYMIYPIDKLRCYDSEEALPFALSHRNHWFLRQRFLIWSVGDRGRWRSSLDSYSSSKKAMTEENLAVYISEDMPVIGRTGYVKTHSHSLHEHYWMDGREPPLSRAKPFLSLLHKTGVPVESMSVGEAMNSLEGREK